MINMLVKSVKNRIDSFRISQKYWVYSLGESMLLYRHQDTKELLLVNEATGSKIRLVDDFGSIVHITTEDIDFERINQLESSFNAEKLWARYYYGVERYQEGVAMITWTLYPDGRYFADEDGFGGEGGEEVNIYGFMDKEGKILIPFRDMKSHEFVIWHEKAVERKTENR